jgi:hypothetical protein
LKLGKYQRILTTGGVGFTNGFFFEDLGDAGEVELLTDVDDADDDDVVGLDCGPPRTWPPLLLDCSFPMI